VFRRPAWLPILLNGGFGYEDYLRFCPPFGGRPWAIDRLLDLVDAAQHGGAEDNYPPCNVERLSEDRYPDLAGGGGVLARRR